MAAVPDGGFAFHDRRRDSVHEGFLAHKRMRWLGTAMSSARSAPA
jgi:hypothetical protein